MIRYYPFHGLHIKLETEADEIPCIFEKTLGVKPTSSFNRKEDISLIFESRDKNRAIDIPKEAKERIFLKRERNLAGTFDGKKLFLTDSKSTVTIDYKKGKAHFLLDSSTLKFKKLFSHTFMPLPIVELMKKHGFYYVHASCADLNGTGILFVGGPATGKSTACYGILREGGNWISDDAVFIKRIGENIIAHSFLKEFHVFMNEQTTLPEFAKIKRTKNGKVDLYKEELVLPSFRPVTKPKLIVLIQKGEEANNNIKYVKASDAIGKIISENEFLFLNKRFTKSVLEDLKTLCKQCKLMYSHNKNTIDDSKRYLNELIQNLD